MECVFESDFEIFRCNDSHLYKNAYKERFLLKMFQESVGVEMVLLEVSKQVTKSHGKPWMKRVLIPSLFIIYPPNSRNHLKGLSCSFQPFLIG